MPRWQVVLFAHMPVDTTLYDILGVSPNASQKDIKRAYKRSALRWHPDKNPDSREEAEENFRQCADAYAVLSDPVQREQYDAFGSRDEGQTRHQRDNRGQFTAFDVFEQVFGGTDPFAVFEEDMASFMGSFGFDDSLMFGRPRGRGRQEGRGRQHARTASTQSNSLFGGSFGSGFGAMNSMLGSMMNDMASMSMQGSQSADRPSAGTYTSSSTRTVICNGKRVTKTTKKIHHADGRVEVLQDEVIGDAALLDQQRPAGQYAPSLRRLHW